jgi:hypothetical protein
VEVDEFHLGVEDVEPEEEYMEPEEESKKTKSKKSQPMKLLPITADGALNISIPNSLNCLSHFKPAKSNVPYKVTLLYTLKFCNENFSTEVLYPKLFVTPKFEPLANPDQYLPLAEKSILFASASTVKPKINQNFIKETSWQSLKRLEGKYIYADLLFKIFLLHQSSKYCLRREHNKLWSRNKF